VGENFLRDGIPIFYFELVFHRTVPMFDRHGFSRRNSSVSEQNRRRRQPSEAPDRPNISPAPATHSMPRGATRHTSRRFTDTETIVHQQLTPRGPCPTSTMVATCVPTKPNRLRITALHIVMIMAFPVDARRNKQRQCDTPESSHVTSPLSTANLTRLPENLSSNSSSLISLLRSSVASNCSSWCHGPVNPCA